MMEKIRPKLRIILLILEILLPFMIYWALVNQNQALAVAAGGLFGLSMLTLVLFG